MVRIRYWYQTTNETGQWVLSGLMLRTNAEKILKANIYERAEIVDDSVGA